MKGQFSKYSIGAVFLFLLLIITVISLVTLTNPHDLKTWLSQSSFLELALALTSSIGVAVATLAYLNGKSNLQSRVNVDVSDAVQLSRIKKELYKELAEELKTLKMEGNPLTNLEALEKLISAKIDEGLQDSIETILSKNYTNTYERSKNQQFVLKQIKSLQFGISFQLDRLTRSGNLNLIIGLLLTIIALFTLGSLVFSTQLADFLTKGREFSAMNYYSLIIPRVSFAIFIEVTSFFFLNLYKRALEDIKYYQNERTNVDSKTIALQVALNMSDGEALAKVINSFSNVERNFILKKGESTTIGAIKSDDYNIFKDAVTSLAKLIQEAKEKD